MLAIKKARTFSNKENFIVLTDKFSNKAGYGFSEKEQAYISEQINKQDKKLVALNRLNQLILVLIVEKNKPLYQQAEALRKCGSCVANRLNEFKATSVQLYSEEVNPSLILALTEGIVLSNYQFIKHRSTAAKEKNSLNSIQVYAGAISEKDLNELAIVSEATCHARDLVNEPVNVLNAVDLAKDFQQLGKKAGFKVEVLNKAAIQKLKMGGLLSVNQGSIDPPTFSIMEYKPKNAKNKKPYVLVGKGVVYDTGGLSLKPTTNSMDSMKCDMGGAAAVACALYAIAKAKLPVHIITLVPATDNRPGGNAFAPGDIITMYDGTTIEMLNSDAEGRMILADALAYAKKYKPELAIELSTLTGASAAAIGHLGIVSMGTADEKTHNALKRSGENTYERLAEFPFWEEYDELLKSDIADMKNIGVGFGGAITAGKFLNKFTDYPYLHLDIAGPAFINTRESYRIKGGTGVGVRLLFDFFKNV